MHRLAFAKCLLTTICCALALLVHIIATLTVDF